MKLSPTQRLIMIALNQRSLLTLEQLATFTGASPVTIPQITRPLVYAGYISTYRREHVSYYMLIKPFELPSLTPPMPSDIATRTT